MSTILYYAHDPMCSWCWGFRPAWAALLNQLPDQVHVRRLLGGLAPDDDTPMDEDMRRFLQNTWQRIQQQIPETEFNFDFWEKCRPRRSTYPACRAVIAARQQGPEQEEIMVYAIQRAYYLQARNPSNRATLVELAQEIGLDAVAFLRTLDSDATQDQLRSEIDSCRRLGMGSFPSLMLDLDGSRWPIAVDYTNADAIREQIQFIID